ncbi:Suppressor of cytokine signaling 5-like protein [Aphelenchoides bicaudatus]|nr:Suppressor of cytokine signaling 5-like protein [Aphelenchoides bicaudatus]
MRHKHKRNNGCVRLERRGVADQRERGLLDRGFVQLNSNRRREHPLPESHITNQHAYNEASMSMENVNYLPRMEITVLAPDAELTEPIEVAIMEDLQRRMRSCEVSKKSPPSKKRRFNPKHLKTIPSAVYRAIRGFVKNSKQSSISKDKATNLSAINSDSPTNIPSPAEVVIDRSNAIMCPGLKDAVSFPFYFGPIDRHDAAKLLDGMEHGSFLLRDSSHNDFRFSVSFRVSDATVHARICYNKGKYTFKMDDSMRFSSTDLQSFLEHYNYTNRHIFDEPYLLKAKNRTQPFSLQSLCTATIVSRCTPNGLQTLPIPESMKANLAAGINMLKETIQICDPIEPLVSILYDKDIDALLTCTYSKNTQERSGQIRILDKLTLNDVFSLRLSSAAFHLDYQQHADLYVTGLGDGQIALFNAKTRQLQVDQPKPFAGQMITDAQVSKDLRQVVFSDKSSALRVYERENSTVVFDQPKAHALCGQSVDAWCCSFLDTPNLVASGGDDNLLKIWDMREHEKSTAAN